MTKYFLGLIVFAFVGAVIFSLVPEGTSKRYVRLLCGLCSIGCIAFPIFELINGEKIELDEITALFDTSVSIDENTVEIYKDSLNSATLKNAEEALKNDIIQAVSAKYDDIDVKILLNKSSDEIYIDKINVFIYPSGYSIDPDAVKKVCRGRLGKECNIIYK